MKRLLVLALVVGLAATACGSNKKSSSKGGSTSVTISNEQGTTWTCGFNPFNASVNFLSFGTEYEELTYVDGLKSGATTTWLAKSYAWSNGNKTLTFTIRDGVKWSDGKPFSAADVVYTFQLLKKHPALDLNADWSVLKSVTQNGNKVVFNFKTPAVPYFYYIADQTPIVAKHIWSKIKNPTTYKDEHPVGTGPFTMSSCSPQVIKYKKNPSYWQPGKPSIDTVYYPAFTSNDPANQQLASGKAQWGSQFIPNINTYYLKKSAGQPLLVPAGRQRRGLHQPEGPDPVERRRAEGDGVRDRPLEGLGDRRVRLRAALEPDGDRHADLQRLARPGAGEEGRLRPAEGRADPAAGRLQEVGRHLPDAGRQAALVHDDQHRRLLRLGRVGAGRPGAAEGGRDQGHAREPLEPDLRQRRLQRPVPARLRREPDGRPDAVLRAAPAAVLEELGADRQAGRLQLGAVLESRRRTS